MQETTDNVSLDGKKNLCLGSACNGEVQIFNNTLTFWSFVIGVENTLNVINLALMLCNEKMVKNGHLY